MVTGYYGLPGDTATGSSSEEHEHYCSSWRLTPRLFTNIFFEGRGDGGGLCSLTGKSFIGHARQHEHSDTRAPPPSSRARLKAPALGLRAYTRRASELHRSSLGQTEIFYYTDSFRKLNPTGGIMKSPKLKTPGRSIFIIYYHSYYL